MAKPRRLQDNWTHGDRQHPQTATKQTRHVRLDTDLAHSVRSPRGLKLCIPRFSDALRTTEETSSFDLNQRDQLVLARLGAVAYTDWPKTFFTLSLAVGDRFFASDGGPLLYFGDVRNTVKRPVAGFRLELPVDENPDTKDLILFSTLNPALLKPELAAPRQPDAKRLYIGVGLSALNERVTVQTSLPPEGLTAPHDLFVERHSFQTR